MRIESDSKVLLFTGYISVNAENELARSVPDLRCDLLKVPYHESKSSSSDAFVMQTHPNVAAVTVGGNPYNNPSGETVPGMKTSAPGCAGRTETGR